MSIIPKSSAKLRKEKDVRKLARTFDKPLLGSAMTLRIRKSSSKDTSMWFQHSPSRTDNNNKFNKHGSIKSPAEVQQNSAEASATKLKIHRSEVM
ncbi:hypothetical protein B9Z55_019743 [Caenorhabditis nigoni]|nr:hypothetical protein B9Z55_019743 [Caenorhabditis nigoni]